MFKRTLLAGAVCLAVSLTVSSCDVLDVEPYQQIGSEQALSTEEGFRATLTSAYDDLQDFEWYGQYMMLYPDALADNITAQGGIRYAGVIGNSRGAHLTEWGERYQTINKTNNILASVADLDLDGDDAQQTRDRLRGEALFLRALTYFDLMRTKAYEPDVIPDACSQPVCNQGVIIRTEPTETLDEALQQLPRAPISDVYDLIEEDLQGAISLLDAPSIFAGNQAFFANVAAAQALLAQVQLYRKSYAQAAETATQALETAGGVATQLTADTYEDAFLDEQSPSALFAVNQEANFDGDATFVNEAPGSLTFDCTSFNFQLVPTEDLIDAHEEGDVRLDLYQTVECPILGEVVTRLAKYTQFSGTNYFDDIEVIRLAEVLLIRAEARAESGDESGALADVNDLRQRRGLDSVDLSGGALISEILRQKRIELAFEGERFFDLKRRGMDIPKPQTISQRTVLPYSSFLVLAPLPNNEVLQNEDLQQNRGY